MCVGDMMEVIAGTEDGWEIFLIRNSLIKYASSLPVKREAIQFESYHHYNTQNATYFQKNGPGAV